MPYLVLVLALIVGLVLIVRGVSGADPRTVARVAKWTLVGVVGVLIVFLTATGQLGYVLYAAALLPLILRWRQLRSLARSMGGPSPGQTSDVETHYLRMTLDHDTGEMRGTVLAGRHQGRRVEDLSQPELIDLLRECRVADEQSAALLEAYLDRVVGPDWRGAEAGGGAGASAGGGSMTREEAYEILGLAPGATPEAIKDAHRHLMQKLHPDHGGSTYFAAKINQAKDLLLGG